VHVGCSCGENQVRKNSVRIEQSSLSPSLCSSFSLFGPILCPPTHYGKSVRLEFCPGNFSSLVTSLCSSTIPPDPTMCSYVYCPHTQWQKCINIIKRNISTFFIRCRMALCELYQILYSTGTGSQNPKSITEHILVAVIFLQEIKIRSDYSFL